MKEKIADQIDFRVYKVIWYQIHRMIIENDGLIIKCYMEMQRDRIRNASLGLFSITSILMQLNIQIFIWKSGKAADLSLKFNAQNDVNDYEIVNLRVRKYVDR